MIFSLLIDCRVLLSKRFCFNEPLCEHILFADSSLELNL